MPTPNPRITGTNVLITEKYNYGRQGWTENYVMNVDDTVKPLRAALDLHTQLLTERKKVLPTAVNLVEVRASELGVGNDGLPAAGGAGGSGPGLKAGTPADPDIGWSVRFSDFSNQVRDIQLWRCWISGDVVYPDAKIIGDISPAAKAFCQKAINIMTKVVTTDTGSNGRYVIRSFARPGVLGVVLMNAFSFTLTAERRIKFRVVNAAGADIEAGDLVKLHVVRKQCTRGLSGEARVIANVSGGEDIWDITLDKRFNCSADDLVGVTGKAIKKIVAYYDIVAGVITNLAKRHTGRPFGSTPGRR